MIMVRNEKNEVSNYLITIPYNSNFTTASLIDACIKSNPFMVTFSYLTPIEAVEHHEDINQYYEKATSNHDNYITSENNNEVMSVLEVSMTESASNATGQNVNTLPTATLDNTVIPIKYDLYSILSANFENEYFESGIINPAEKFFIHEYQKDSLGALNTLNKLFWDNYSMDGRKINNLLGGLHTISHMSYNEIYPIGVSMAVGAITHTSSEVAEYGVKCFENWNHPDGIEKLKAVKFSSAWLNEYAIEVIKELKQDNENIEE